MFSTLDSHSDQKYAGLPSVGSLLRQSLAKAIAGVQREMTSDHDRRSLPRLWKITTSRSPSSFSRDDTCSHKILFGVFDSWRSSALWMVIAFQVHEGVNQVEYHSNPEGSKYQYNEDSGFLYGLGHILLIQVLGPSGSRCCGSPRHFTKTASCYVSLVRPF